MPGAPRGFVRITGLCFRKGKRARGQSGQSRVMQPSAITTCDWPDEVWERAKGQTLVLEAEPR